MVWGTRGVRKRGQRTPFTDCTPPEPLRRPARRACTRPRPDSFQCGGTNWPQENTSWINFRKGFERCYSDTGNYIVTSIEYCKDPGGCGQWIGEVANLWRTEGDIQNTWGSVSGNIHGQ